MAADDRREGRSSPEGRVRATCLRCGAHLTAIVVLGETVGECSTCGSSLVEALRDAPLIESAMVNWKARAEAQLAPSVHAATGRRAVVIDDHPLICQALQRTLVGAGYEVAGIATDGQTGLEMVLSERPDVAIVDLDLPQLGGLDVIRGIRAAGLDTRVLIFTASGEDSIPPGVIDAADGIVAKTAGAGDLVEAIRTVTETRS